LAMLLALVLSLSLSLRLVRCSACKRRVTWVFVHSDDTSQR
jgi:hypothetical protein